LNQRPVAHIDQSACDGCLHCTVSSICPRDAVEAEPAGAGSSESGGRSLSRFRRLLGTHEDRLWRVDESKCAGCLLCAPYCPHHAVVPKERGRAA